VGGRCSGTRLQRHILSRALENSVKIDSITVNQAGGLDFVLEKEIYLLEILKGAAAFEIKN